VLLEPAFDTQAWFAGLDRYHDVPFMDDGRNQPITPVGSPF
jgi:hypothetical protein